MACDHINIKKEPEFELDEMVSVMIKEEIDLGITTSTGAEESEDVKCEFLMEEEIDQGSQLLGIPKSQKMSYNLRNRTIREVLLEEKESENEEILGENSSESEDHVSEVSESESDTSDESDSELENATLASRILDSNARGRPRTKLPNGYTWTTQAPKRISDRLSDVPPVYIPGPVGDAEHLNKFEEFWDILFCRKIIDIIVEHTNTKIKDVCAGILATNDNLQTYHHHTDAAEIRAFIGILYYSGLWRTNMIDTEQLWDRQNGTTFYQSIMNRNRFCFLTNCLRFDDKKNRDPSDKFSPIREIWDIFIGNCSNYYRPHRNCTVDEQLLGFRGNCSFRVYIKSKPDRYGLKFHSLNDATTAYMIYAVPYLGAQSTAEYPKGRIPEYSLIEVTKPIYNSGRTVTCDNWYTSIPALENMLKSPYKISMTGTLRKNKREIPAEMKVVSKTVPDNKFCFSKDIVLLSHTAKKNKIVLIASTEIKSTEIVNKNSKINLFYNETKGGVDTFDKLCHSRTVHRRTLRWPLRVFFGMLDMAAVNSRILVKCKSNANTPKKEEYSKMLQDLCIFLVRDYSLERYKNPSCRRYLKKSIAGILKIDEPEWIDTALKAPKRTRCLVCVRKSDKKSRYMCISCTRPMCDEHRSGLCVECAGIE